MLLQVLRLSLLNASKDKFFFQELVKNGGQLSDEVISKTVDKMFVLFGCEILKIVPGNLYWKFKLPIIQLSMFSVENLFTMSILMQFLLQLHSLQEQLLIKNLNPQKLLWFNLFWSLSVSGFKNFLLVFRLSRPFDLVLLIS